MLAKTSSDHAEIVTLGKDFCVSGQNCVVVDSLCNCSLIRQQRPPAAVIGYGAQTQCELSS